MADRGKCSRAVFESQIAPRLGADRADVAVGPKHGVDFGVVDVDGAAVVLATDPVSVLPQLGFDRAGRFATRIVLADVAVSGLRPTHLTISFSLPPALSESSFGTLWTAIHEECRSLGVSVVTGHTARYTGCSFPWVGAATGLAVGEHDAIVRPDGARVGDDLVVTTGPAVEAAALFANLFPEEIPCESDRLARVAARLDDLDAVRAALAASDAGDVSAMHDITEGGLLGALHEMADGSGTRFVVERDRVPTDDDVAAVCAALGMDRWTATSAGSLLLAVPPDSTRAVLQALREQGPAAVIGRVESGVGVVVDGEPTERPTADSSWPVYEALLEGDVD